MIYDLSDLIKAITMVDGAAASSSISDLISNALYPSLAVVLATLISLFILLIIGTFFAYKPIRNVISKRADYIENNIKKSEYKNNVATYNMQKSEVELRRSQQDARYIVERATKDASEKASTIVSNAKDRATNIIEDANKTVNTLRHDLEENAKKQIIELSLSLTSQLIEKNISLTDNKVMIDSFIKQLEQRAKED